MLPLRGRPAPDACAMAGVNVCSCRGGVLPRVAGDACGVLAEDATGDDALTPVRGVARGGDRGVACELLLRAVTPPAPFQREVWP